MRMTCDRSQGRVGGGFCLRRPAQAWRMAGGTRLSGGGSERTWSFAWQSAPAAMSSCTHAGCPLEAAHVSTV